MAVRDDVLKGRIKRGETVLVPFVRLPEPGLVEILGYAGLDGVIIDMEHGAIPPPEYFAAMNAEILVGAMIEDAQAAGELDAIAAVGLDVLFLGTADLAASVGEIGAFAHPTVVEIGRLTVAAVAKHGGAAGFASRSRESASNAIQHGYRVIALGSVENLLLHHVRDLASAVRRSAEGKP